MLDVALQSSQRHQCARRNNPATKQKPETTVPLYMLIVSALWLALWLALWSDGLVAEQG